MKVLFLNHTLGGGGAEKVLVNLVNNLDSQKYDVTLMTIINTGINRTNLAAHVKYKSVINLPFKENKQPETNEATSGSLLSGGGLVKKLFAAGYSFLWKVIPIKWLYRLAVKEKYDVEVAFLEGVSAKFIAASNNPDSKKISWIHVDLLNERKSEKFFWTKRQERRCYETFDQLVCVSETVKQSVVKKFGFAEHSVLVKYNPIDPAEIIAKAKVPTSAVKPDKFLMVTIGRLIQQKGYDRLLRVAKQLAVAGFEFELWIIGDGLDRPVLAEFIASNQLSQYVKLLGFKKNPYQYLRHADLFVCSSYAEGFSTVASEAVILGIPVVTVDCSGMKELFGAHNEYGIVTENTEQALHNGLVQILSDYDLYRYYQAQVLERQPFFDLAKTVKEIEQLLVKGSKIDAN